MRPLSLASLFAGLGGTTLGFINALKWVSHAQTPISYGPLVIGLAEALIPTFVAFGCLTVGWLCVAYGMTRQT